MLYNKQHNHPSQREIEKLPGWKSMGEYYESPELKCGCRLRLPKAASSGKIIKYDFVCS